jgi:D-alanyl-lipoteichoic acid acyltransferase DltB (MBOAT superfamily)
MSGATLEFIAFSLLTALIFNIGRTALVRQSVLLIASLVFLGTFSSHPLEYIPFLGFLAAGYLCLRLVQYNALSFFFPAILSVLLLFVWLKKYTFIPSQWWLGTPYITIGMSYILFRLLHLLIEARDDPVSNRVTIFRYFGYLINFTTLVAGPIQRYDDFIKQQQNIGSKRLYWADIAVAFERIVKGMFKTNVLAALFSLTSAASLERVLAGCGVNGSFADGAAIFVLYPLFLYCNFSGYIDIVIGVAKLLLHQLPENFNRPFSSTNFIDFWNRWHMTLSMWLKTYIYTPLLMTLVRRFPSRKLESVWAVLAFFVTFFLVGVWHGQTLEFLFFGFLQGFGVSVNKIYQLTMQRQLGKKRYAQFCKVPIYIALSRGLTFAWFGFTLLWFWGSWMQIIKIVQALGFAQCVAIWLIIIGTASLLLAMWESLREYILTVFWNTKSNVQARIIRLGWSVMLASAVCLMMALSNQPGPEIVYKAF